MFKFNSTKSNIKITDMKFLDNCDSDAVEVKIYKNL